MSYGMMRVRVLITIEGEDWRIFGVQFYEGTGPTSRGQALCHIHMWVTNRSFIKERNNNNLTNKSMKNAPPSSAFYFLGGNLTGQGQSQG